MFEKCLVSLPRLLVLMNLIDLFPLMYGSLSVNCLLSIPVNFVCVLVFTGVASEHDQR